LIQGCSLRRAALIRGLMTDDEWAYFEPFLIYRGGGRPPRNHRRTRAEGSGGKAFPQSATRLASLL
jgi:hypothetical protein